MIRNLFAAAGLTVLALPVAASEWRGQITPYVWATGLGGDITPFTGAPTISFDKSFSDLMEDLDGAFFLSGYARRDRLVVMGDFSWSSSSKSGRISPGVPAEGKLSQTSLTMLVGYRAMTDARLALDLLAGARVWSVKGSVSAAGGALTSSPSEGFVDPILALRANVRLAPRWSALVYLDFGGFGVGSEQTGQIVATANYQVNDSLYLSVGYRHLSFDYRSGGTRMDVIMSGPLVGLTWRF